MRHVLLSFGGRENPLLLHLMGAKTREKEAGKDENFPRAYFLYTGWSKKLRHALAVVAAIN